MKSAMTYAEIEAGYGEETAINVAIARDPEDQEWTDEDFAKARPASEVHTELVERWRRSQGKRAAPAKADVRIQLDTDIVEHFRKASPDWQTRLNDALRRLVFPGDGAG